MCGFESRWVLWQPCPTREAYKHHAGSTPVNRSCGCNQAAKGTVLEGLRVLPATATCTEAKSGRGPAWSGRVPWEHENVGSNPTVLTECCHTRPPAPYMKG